MSAELLQVLIDEIRGLRDDMRKRGGLPDVKIGKNKTAPQYEGKAASECPADFLLDYAGFLEWKAGKNREDGKDGYAASNERFALMCRRWAAVNRGVVAEPEKLSFRKPAEQPTSDAPEAPSQKSWGGGGWKRS